jgi:hypothetical protein
MGHLACFDFDLIKQKLHSFSVDLDVRENGGSPSTEHEH